MSTDIGSFIENIATDKSVYQNSSNGMQESISDMISKKLDEKFGQFFPVKKKFGQKGFGAKTATSSGDTVIDKSKKIKKPAKVLPRYIRNYSKVISLTVPREISDQTNRKYAVKVDYIDAAGNPHEKTVKFGEKGNKEFFEDKDMKRRNKRVSKFKNDDNILYPNYWNSYYLNHKSGDLQKAYMEILQEHNLGI